MEKCPLCGAPGCALFVGFCCNNIKCTNYVPDKSKKDRLLPIVKIFKMEPESYLNQIQAEWSKMFKSLLTESINSFRIIE